MFGKLRFVRIFIALIFLLIFILLFLGIPAIMPGHAFREGVTFFQFVPSVLRFLSIFSITVGGFIFVVLLTVIIGRAYCSVFCPLGIFQDVISRIGMYFRKRKIYRYSKPKNYLRFGLLALVVISLFTGSIFLLNLLDPYSNFGKIWSQLFRPLAILVNDGLSNLFEKARIYSFSPVGIKTFHWECPVYPFIFLTTITIMAGYRGRLFCNTICPVGSVLSLISKLSIFKIKIDQIACSRCGKCSTVCKSECINVKTKQVDFDRCVGCYNCINICPESSINFERLKTISKVANNADPLDQKTVMAFAEINIEPNNPPNIFSMAALHNDRRKFIGNTLLLIAGVQLMALKTFASVEKVVKSGKTSYKKKFPVSPPGSYSIANFTKHCTACQLCVSECPTQVLQPSFGQYGTTNLMQPHMDYDHSFCNYECTKCSEVCPNGAIYPINVEHKKTVQNRESKFSERKLRCICR